MKSTFLGKESTSPVKVVNCTQSRQSTNSVRVGKWANVKEQDLKGVNTIQGKTTEILGTKRDSVTV